MNIFNRIIQWGPIFIGIDTDGKQIVNSAIRIISRRIAINPIDDKSLLGNIIIGKSSIIGGNVWLTETLEPGTKVTIPAPELTIKKKK
jgi:hypothetical protein